MCLVILPVHGVFNVYVAVEMCQRIGPEPALDRAGLDQAYVNVGAFKLHGQRHGQAFKRMLGGVVGAAEAHRNEAQDRGALDDAAMPLRPHHRDHPPGQIMPAEEVGLELGPERIDREILDRTDLAVAAIVEQRVAASAGGRHSRVEECGDAAGVGVVEPKGFDAVVAERCDVFFGTGGGYDIPALGLERAGTVSTNPA